MRKIKFRVWNGEYMISPDYITREGVAFWKEDSIPTSSREIMQFTGILDKNGKEIYEGDVIKYLQFTIIIKWIEDKAKFNIFDYTGINSNNIEVIGNIYENPELVEKTK